MAHVINPVEVTDAILNYTNVPEPDTANGDPAVYVAGTTYAEGDLCCVVATHKIYESLVGSNTGNYPPTDVLTDEPKWAEKGYTNKWKVFDPYVNTQSVKSDLLFYRLDATRTSAVALFNVEGTSVTLTLRGGDLAMVETTTITLIEDTCVDWYDYFFSEIIYKDRVVWEYPVVPSGFLDITVSATDGTAKAGIIKHGLIKYIGDVAQDVSAGIIDFSVKQEDSYGRIYLKRGAYRDVLDVLLYIQNEATDRVSLFLKSLRAKGCVWCLDNEPELADTMASLLVYGFFKDFGVVIKTKHPGSIDECSLTVEGLI